MAVTPSPASSLASAAPTPPPSADSAGEAWERQARRTFTPRVLSPCGPLAACFRLDFNEQIFQRNYRDPVLLSRAVSVGPKAALAAQRGRLDVVGQDAVALAVNELAAGGAEPLFCLPYASLPAADPAAAENLLRGVADGCVLAGCAMLGAETRPAAATDVAGFAVGVCELGRLVSGDRAHKGDLILGLASSGLHVHGWAVALDIVQKAGLDLDTIYPDLHESRPLGDVLLEPTRNYARKIVTVLRRYRVKQVVGAMAHVASGGLSAAMARLLGEGLSARLSERGAAVPPVFAFLQKHGGLDEATMARTFNMGLGYLMVVRPAFAASIVQQLRRLGEKATVIGKVAAA